MDDELDTTRGPQHLVWGPDGSPVEEVAPHQSVWGPDGTPIWSDTGEDASSETDPRETMKDVQTWGADGEPTSMWSLFTDWLSD